MPLKSIFKWHLNLSGVGATGPNTWFNFKLKDESKSDRLQGASGLCDDDPGCYPVFCRATAVDNTDVAARAVFVRRRTNSAAE